MNEFKIFLLIVGGTCQKQPRVPIICEVYRSGITSRQPGIMLIPWLVERDTHETWVGVYE